MRTLLNEPFSRRQALTRLGVLATGAALLPVKSQAAKPSFSFVHLTDLHIMPENNAVAGVHQALETVARLKEKPAFALIGGDIVHAASHADRKRTELLYDLWQESSTSLKLRAHYAVGNGDCFGTAGNAGITPDDPEFGKRWWQKRLALSHRFETFEHQGWRFIVLDSVQTGGDEPYYGEIDKEQLDWLDGIFRKSDPKQPTVILTHIPLLTAYGLYDDDAAFGPPSNMIVRNNKVVMEILQGRNIKAVFQGHTHAVEECYYAGVRYISGGAVCGNWWQGKRFGIHPEGFGVITIKGDDLTYRYTPYGWNVKTAGEKEPWKFPHVSFDASAEC